MLRSRTHLKKISGIAHRPDGRRALLQRLRAAKRQASLTVALADIAGAWQQEEVAASLTRLADAAVACALGQLLEELQPGAAPLCPWIAIYRRRRAGLPCSVWARLARESSPIRANSTCSCCSTRSGCSTGDGASPRKRFTVSFATLATLLGERTDDGCVYRTDLNFRPNMGATPLALSIAAAEQYYESHGQNWERAAMIKARPVAGDPAVGADMMERLRPFVWRKYLDFAAIQDIQSIKRQIAVEPDGRPIDVAGHDIERGRGGIRQIELYAQTQQLIWGGRDPSLRVRATLRCPALACGRQPLQRRGGRRADRVVPLSLRRLEHRLEMIDDEAETWLYRTTGTAAPRVARLMGLRDEAGLAEAVLAHAHAVEEHYAALFEDEPALGGEGGNLVFTGTADDPDTLASLRRMGFGDATVVSATVRHWHHGRIMATRSTRARELLTELMPALLRALAGTADPDSAFRKLDEFLRGLPSGVQPFLLLHDNPRSARPAGGNPGQRAAHRRAPEPQPGPARRPRSAASFTKGCRIGTSCATISSGPSLPPPTVKPSSTA